MLLKICYVVVRDKFRPISEEYVETRTYAIANKVTRPGFMGRPPRIDPELCDIIYWSTIDNARQMLQRLLDDGYTIEVPEKKE